MTPETRSRPDNWRAQDQRDMVDSVLRQRQTYPRERHSKNRADAVRLLKSRIGEAATGKSVDPAIQRTLARILTDDYKAMAA